MFNMKRLEGDKVAMSELLQHIPELDVLFFQLEKKHTFMKISNHQQSLAFPKKILDSFHMTRESFY